MDALNERPRIGRFRSQLAPDGEMPGYRRMTLANAAMLTEAMAAAKGSRGIEAMAREMGVSRRTAYRWRGARFHEVTVGGWRATFVTRPSHAEGVPIQVTPWVPEP